MHGILLLQSQFPRIRNSIALTFEIPVLYCVYNNSNSTKVTFFWNVMPYGLVDRY